MAAAFGAAALGAACAGSAGFAGTEAVAGSGAMMLIGGIDAELGKSPETGLPVGRSGSPGIKAAADGTAEDEDGGTIWPHAAACLATRAS